jgi:phage major head subunit gpT-like protein
LTRTILTFAGLALVMGLAVLFGQPAEASTIVLADPSLAGMAFGGIVVNQANLRSLYVGFKANFQGGLDSTVTHYKSVAMTVPSSTKEEDYGWLGKFPKMREWIGDRVVHGITTHGYTVKNKPFELTIGVSREDIADDNIGIYAPLFKGMGESVAAHPDELVFDLLKAGFGTACYDGQYMFDTDHPVLDANGQVTSVANTDGGAGTNWFLMDLSRSIKPVIWQERQKPNFVAKDKDTDDNVFDRKEYVYGVDSRDNVGFGLWQLAWGSKQSLDKTHYKLARESMQGMKGDHGRPLGIRPTHLVVPPSLEEQALELLNAERNSAGATNVYRGTAQLIVCPWLA